MKTTKDFDCVKMMRDIRDKVNSEIVKMDSAQIIEYFRKKSEEYEMKYGQQAKEANKY
jgi:hypothetical protein